QGNPRRPRPGKRGSPRSRPPSPACACGTAATSVGPGWRPRPALRRPSTTTARPEPGTAPSPPGPTPPARLDLTYSPALMIPALAFPSPVPGRGWTDGHPLSILHLDARVNPHQDQVGDE